MPTKTHGNASQYQSAYTSGQHGTHNFASGRFTTYVDNAHDIIITNKETSCILSLLEVRSRIVITF